MEVISLLLKILGITIAILFTIYYFNLDSKLLQKLYIPMMKYFDGMERDRKI